MHEPCANLHVHCITSFLPTVSLASMHAWRAGPCLSSAACCISCSTMSALQQNACRLACHVCCMRCSKLQGVDVRRCPAPVTRWPRCARMRARPKWSRSSRTSRSAATPTRSLRCEARACQCQNCNRALAGAAAVALSLVRSGACRPWTSAAHALGHNQCQGLSASVSLFCALYAVV